MSLGNLQDIRAQNALLDALDSPETVLQQAAIAALGEIKAVDSLEQLLKFVASEDWLVRQRLAEALGNLQSAKSLSALKFLSKDDHPQVRLAAIYSLERLTMP